MRRVLLGAAVALGALWGVGPAAAWAHPLLIQATPQPGLVVSGAPSSISVALTEPAVARGSRIRLFGPRGAPVAVSAVRATGGRRTISVSPQANLRSAVYDVRWSVLGDDGHIVSGSFDFGVAGAGGAAPPGAERLSGSGGGRGGESAASDSIVQVAGRWLGILAASVLFGGFVLAALLRRRRGPGEAGDAGVAILRRLASRAWILVAAAAAEGVVAAALAGPGSSFDLGLLTASASGVSSLARAILVAAVTLALVATARRRATPDRLYLGAGAAVLLTYALSGHALSFPTFWALLDQAVHVLAAGLWLGGVVALALLAGRGSVQLAEGARAFAPVGGAALGAAIVTGVMAAVREVDGWYFLRWSDYGRIVVVKALLVGCVALAGAAAWWRSRGRGAPGPRTSLLRAEAAGVVLVVALAATLSGLAQGRGQPLPAQRGTLFAGPALATALLPAANAPVGLFPARTGPNVITVSTAPGRPAPKQVRIRLVCGACGGAAAVRARLLTQGGLTWSARVRLPRDGTWFGYVTVDGIRAPPVQLAVGVPAAAGAPPAQVLAVADVSGPYAERCRAHVIGLQLAIARLNAGGGVDGGHKVALLVLDSGATAAGAATAAARGLAAKPIASAGACGAGAVAAVDAASRAGIPSVVGDPAVDPTAAPDVFRLAADPYAQGLAFGQLVRDRILAAGAPGVRTVRADVGGDLQSRRLLAGLRIGLRASSAVRGVPVTPSPAPKLALVRPGSLARLSADGLQRAIGRDETTALILDGPDAGGADARAIARLGVARGARLAPAPLLLSERVLSETYVLSAGALGRIGAVQGVSEVATNTSDAELYRAAVPLLFRGDLASVDGLRGYATGLALRDALRGGTGARSIAGFLREPRVFTNALLAPWSPREPGAGSPFAVALQPQFLAPTLVPSSLGGEAKDSAYFPQGSWTVTSRLPLGIVPGLSQPPVR
ncbi:MAG: copper transport protein [Solirubrobacteraceae bacterium]|jgi:methionine-rich copper-binding protein CopC/putative copper export protein|nr:copper transport protein [Solirubrobacteraceae bacterium]